MQAFGIYERKAVAVLSQAIEDVFSAFVAANGDRAARLAFVTLRHRTDAEDVAQEAFYRLWRHCLRHGPETLSHALLYQTVVNLCRDRMRYHRRHPEDTVDPLDITQPGPGGPDRDQAMAIAQAVEALKPGEQEAILLFYYLALHRIGRGVLAPMHVHGAGEKGPLRSIGDVHVRTRRTKGGESRRPPRLPPTGRRCDYRRKADGHGLV